MLAALALLWLGGLLWFAATLPERLDDPRTPADVVVVLTGGSDRVATGLGLLESGLGRRLLVSGVHKGVDVAELIRLGRGTAPAMAERPDLAERIVLGYAADDTIGNAAETAAWMRREGFTSLRLVTAAYHMPRSLLEFRRRMPDATIIAHPVFPSAFKRREWWRRPGTAHLLATEYTKYLAAWIRPWILPDSFP